MVSEYIIHKIPNRNIEDFKIEKMICGFFFKLNII